MVRKGKRKAKDDGILKSETFRDNVKEKEKIPEYDQAEFDELYPDYTREEPHKEVEEIIEETRRDVPISDDVKMDIFNRLVGIQNIANETKMDKYKKIIMLAQECIDMLDMDKAEEVKDE